MTRDCLHWTGEPDAIGINAWEPALELNFARSHCPSGKGRTRDATAEAVLAFKSINDKRFLRKSLLFGLAVAIVEHAPRSAFEVFVLAALQRPEEGDETESP
ncbi:hypothetical protein D3C87_1923480 [compost metagenome]